MGQIVAGVFLLLIGTACGAWLPSLIAEWRAEGPNAQCIRLAGQTICKGQAIQEVWWDDRKLGGIVAISCDYERPGMARLNGGLLRIPEIVRGCESDRYVVSFHTGTMLTNFWVTNGRIEQIDRMSAESS